MPRLDLRQRRRCACLFAPALLALSFESGCGADKDPLDTLTAGSTGDAGTGDTETGDATGDETGATMTGGATGDATDPAWMTPYCYTVADKKWIGGWIERESEVLALVNEARAGGADCGSMGTFEPAGPLTMEARLHCAARKHSQDMAERDFFDHTNPDGQDPFDRMAEAGYVDFASAGENIAAGSDDPVTTVQGWLDSDGHCANMMNPQYKHFGVGFYEGPGSWTYYWTQTFAAPLQ